MNIFHVVNSTAVDKIGGGAELFAVRLLEHIHNNANCYLIVIRQCNTEKELEVLENLKGKVEIHFLTSSCKGKVSKLLLIIRKFIGLINKYSPQIINSHGALPDLINALAKVVFGHRIKSIRTVHLDTKWINNVLLEKLFINFIFPFVFDLEISISKATKDRLDKRLFSRILGKKSPVIYNGISDSVIELRPINTQNFAKELNPQRTSKIISIGRLSEQKGYSTLLRAIALSKEKAKLELYIFGDGPLRSHLQKLAEGLGVQDITHFMGFKNDVLNFMMRCELFVSSSLWEGFPTVILEAMALGVPVIATDVSGSRELIINGETGILIPPSNPEALSKATIQMVANPEYAQTMALNARRKVSQYLMENIAIRYLDIYNCILSEKEILS